MTELTTFIHASAHDLHQLADGSVQMIATSPPYYGLRAYAGEQGVEWPKVTFRLNEWVEATTIAGCDPECEHEWGGYRTPGISGGPNPKQDSNRGAHHTGGDAAYCSRCGGWRGGLGMEPTPVAFIGHLILCLREWRRVLRDDGIAMINLGDSYAGGGGYYPDAPSNQNGHSLQSSGNLKGERNIKGRGTSTSGVKPKDLLGIPWLFAIAARADGWFLRSDIIWAKPNPMPESVTDRPTKSHEYVFLLAKSQRYFYDAEAVKEQTAGEWTFEPERRIQRVAASGGALSGGTGDVPSGGTTRNLRTVWTIATQPTPFAHFATFPEKLVEPMIRAGSSERGACPHCGKAWVRNVQKSGGTIGNSWHDHTADELRGMSQQSNHLGSATDATGKPYTVTDLGFAPACTCPAHEPVPCVVLDPFNGSGTTGKVAIELGRRYIGIDISEEYLNTVTSERFGEGVQIGMGL